MQSRLQQMSGIMCIISLRRDNFYNKNIFFWTLLLTLHYPLFPSIGCCGSPHTKRCCYATVGLGGVFLLAGIVLLVAGPSMLEKKILATMALSPGSDRLQSWLVPPVQAHLTGYAFHVVNPEEVQQGGKPVLQEVGPFVYKAVTVKDSVDQDTRKEHLEYNQDGETLTYSPR